MTGPGWELDVPSEDDWELVRDLRIAALRDSPEAFLESVASAEARDEAGWRARVSADPGRRSLIARDDAGRWLGSMTIVTTEDRVWLVGAWVAPDHRGTGVAEALLRAQLEWARAALGADRLWLHVTEGNDRARRLYERVGFRATGVVDRFEGYDGDSNEMVILLAR